MYRFIFFVLGFVLAFALLINMGCATTQGDILAGIMDELEGPNQTYQVPKVMRAGWQPTSDSGNHWVLRGFIGGGLHLLATCDYTYMKYNGVEKWKGRYFGMNESLNYHGPVWDNDLNNLVGCVDWVKTFYYGDYTI